MLSLAATLLLLAALWLPLEAKDHLEQIETLHSQLRALHSVEDSVYSRLSKELEAVRRSRTSREIRCGSRLKKFVQETCGEIKESDKVNLTEKCCNAACDDVFIKTSLCPEKLAP